MITGYIVGSEQVIKKLENALFVARADIRQTILRLTIQLLRNVKSDKLSGGVLNVRTGRLRRSINQKIEESPDKILGKVGTNVVYGRIFEYGFDGTENVRSHLRTIKSAFGKQLNSPVTFSVSAHTRNVHVPERSFLRSALKEMEPLIKEELSASVRRSIKL